jgi:hypothetical protein
MAAYTQTETAVGAALSSATSGAWINIPRGSNQQNTGGGAGPIVRIVATSVTTGATVAIEGRNVSASAGASATKPLHSVAVAADSTVIVPLKDLLENGAVPEQIRMTVSGYTDGTYTTHVLTAA